MPSRLRMLPVEPPLQVVYQGKISVK